MHQFRLQPLKRDKAPDSQQQTPTPTEQQRIVRHDTWNGKHRATAQGKRSWSIDKKYRWSEFISVTKNRILNVTRIFFAVLLAGQAAVHADIMQHDDDDKIVQIKTRVFHHHHQYRSEMRVREFNQTLLNGSFWWKKSCFLSNALL